MKDLEDFKKNLVLKASAGSGKTHELASRFVLLLSFYYIYKKNGSFEGISLPKGISSIMALTFTNKAASEMKERIIDFMKKSVLEEEENISFLNKVEMQELLIDLFKNYDELNVTTIDSFMNRIFKAFSVDLGVYPDYEITFDSDSVFEEMFKRVLLEPQNSELLMDFLTFLLEAGENGMDAEKILKKNLKYYSQIEVPSDILTAEDIEKLFFTKWNISEKEIDLLQWISKKVGEYASELRNFIDSRSQLFNMNNSKKFKNINIKIDDEKLEKIRSFLEEKRFENVVKNGKSLSEKDKNDFINMLSNILKLLKDYKILTVVKEAELAYQIIKVINEFKNKVMREQNIVDGSEIAKKVSELLKSENGVTMAYCRLGETIYHYLIDEFQDTSRVQFESMKPLIDNAISVGGTVFVVGDKKQSIYGWRGGDYTLFDELKNFNQETMKNNYRSGKKIVQFNNETFENLKKNDTFLNYLKKIFLEDESFNDTFKNVYENVEQDLINEFEGHVDICLISEKDFNTDEDKKDILYEFYKNRLINVLISLFNRGYKASDILILVRENDTIPTIIDWVYSEQSLRWLQFITDGNLRIKSDFNIKKILLCALYFINTDDPFYEGALKELWINVINEKRDGHIVVSPYEFFVGIVESLQLQKDIYVKTFLEEVNCLVNKGLTIREILNYFETNDVSLTMGYDIDAIRIMSIHKSKGLEGKVVILPCYDWELNKTIKNLFDTVDLSYFYEDTKGKIFGDMKKLRIFSKKIQDKYNKKLIAEIIENINLMYVANTRAVEELYITGCYSLNEDGNYPKVLKTSSLLNMVIGEEYKNSECSQDKSSNVDMDKIFKELSTPNDMEEKGSKNVKFYRFRKNFVTEPLYDDVLEGGRRGVLIHNLLSKIDVIPDNVEVEEFVEKFLDKQGSGTQVYDDLKKILIKTISDLKDYFYEVNACWTEKEFVTDDGTILRLDRLVKKGDHYTVIDFKTGDKKESDKGQIKRYCNLLPFNVTGVIYYLKTGEKLNV